MLYGPPGCAKTLITKILAAESGFTFLGIRGAELLNKYVGESERAIRDLFNTARGLAPCLIFFDEFDALGNRGEQSGVHVVTTLLNELDGIVKLEGVAVVAATNKPERIDPALLRPGRISDLVYVGLPDFETRRSIMDLNLELVKSSEIAEDIDRGSLAEELEGYSGAEVVAICEEAKWEALTAQLATGKRVLLRQEHFVSAISLRKKSITSSMTQAYQAWGAATQE